ncbi:MAG: hypothetical protein ACRDAT_01915 [Cetobacterium sp.]
MAIVNLMGADDLILMRSIIAENPKVNALPGMPQFGAVRPGVGVRTSINLVGNPGTVAEAAVSGVRTVQYNRVDLTHLVAHQRPMMVYGCETTHDVLRLMAKNWGIEIDPRYVVSEALVADSDTVTLTFQNHNRILINDAVSFSVSWSNLIDVSTRFTESYLDGFVPPWSYMRNLAHIFTESYLDGFTYPSLTMNMEALSEFWHVHDTEMVKWITTRSASGPYSQSALLSLFNEAAPQYPWTFLDSEIADYNLWNTVIVFNGASNKYKMFNSVIQLRVNTTYFHQGSGIVSIYYNQ